MIVQVSTKMDSGFRISAQKGQSGLRCRTRAHIMCASTVPECIDPDFSTKLRMCCILANISAPESSILWIRSSGPGSQISCGLCPLPASASKLLENLVGLHRVLGAVSYQFAIRSRPNISWVHIQIKVEW
jgi:hypothetical protein